MSDLTQDLIFLPSLHYEIETSKRIPAATSYAGLSLVYETVQKLLLHDMKKIKLKQAGYSDEVPLTAAILLLASGGDSVSHWDYLRTEKGFVRFYGLKPCVDVVERYLPRLKFTELVAHAEERDENKGRAGYTETLDPIQIKVVREQWKRSGSPTKLTLDLDAMIIKTAKASALYCYEKVKACQPMNAYCPELKMIIAHEFRDGNISPQLGYKRLVKRCRMILPEVTQWIVRSDSAGYQHDSLDWMTAEKIIYSVTSDQPPGMDKEIAAISEDDWKALKNDDQTTKEEIAVLEHRVSFSSQEECRLRMRCRKYWVLRRPGKSHPYVYHVIVTNDLELSPEEVVKRHRGRCGSVEYFHSQVKGDLGMKRMPSRIFEVNAAWYSLACLTHNILRWMQAHVLPERLKQCEIGTLRFKFLRAAAIVIQKARGIIIRFEEGSLACQVYLQGRRKLAGLSP